MEPLGVTTNWDGHAALGVFLKEEGEEKPVFHIIDPTFSEEPILVENWLELINPKDCLHIELTDPTYYSQWNPGFFRNTNHDELMEFELKVHRREPLVA